jgi:signal transduction histidine kinase/CheY-like chemotaxis protein
MEQQILVEALRDTASILNQSLNLREVLDNILNYIGRVVPHDAANIMLIEDGAARMTACRGYENFGGQERVMAQVRNIDEVPNLRKMAETGQPVVVPDTSLSPDWIVFKTSAWISSYASTPICRKGKTIGFLNLNSATPGFYSQEHADRLLAFADQAAIAIENARLYEKAQAEIAVRKQAEIELQDAKNELEVRVDQRTFELRNANERLQIELIKRKQAERALVEERSLLALRVEERTAALSTANAELAKAAQLKDSFLASMSHELRTPLNAILNISETLQEQVYGELNETQLKSVRTIEESGRHLLSLITDILDLSKIGAGKFELVLDSVPVPEVCQASLKLIEEAARKKDLIVSVKIDPAVKTFWADQRRMKQVLVNLLSNAVKFTPNGGAIGLIVSGDVNLNQVKFTVWDTGIGIPEGSISYLFKPFVQLDNSLARQFEGTGLGLALVYHIVELHGGGIAVKSEQGRGSRFIVTLNWDAEGRLKPGDGPTSPGETAQAEAPGEGLSEPHKRLVRYLNELGIEITRYWMEAETLPDLGSISSDLILLDTRLFNRDELYERMRQLAPTLYCPVLLFESQGQLIDPARIPGNMGLLTFPFTRQELRTVIRSVSRNGTASLCRKVSLFLMNERDTQDQARTILIADDHSTSIHYLADYLKMKGYQIVTAINGIEAVEKTRQIKPDLVLMDIQMPGLDGLEAIRRIRAEETIRRVPIIALTALAMPDDRAVCLQAGANEYISKPVSLKDLSAHIQREIM